MFLLMFFVGVFVVGQTVFRRRIIEICLNLTVW